MKKFLFIMVMLLGSIMTVNAQKQWYQTTSFALARVSNGYYSWGDWESSSMKICFDLGNDIVTIFSPTTQRYKVLTVSNTYTDNSGVFNSR